MTTIPIHPYCLHLQDNLVLTDYIHWQTYRKLHLKSKDLHIFINLTHALWQRCNVWN
jgi:hypothetical protein